VYGRPNAILVKTWDIFNGKDATERDRKQALSISMEAYRMKLDLLTNATVVERAVHFVDKHSGLIPQNTEVLIDNTTEPIKNG
jgi:hypothetical protein